MKLIIAILFAWLLLSIIIWSVAFAEPYAAVVTWSDGSTREVCALDLALCEDPRWPPLLLPPYGHPNARVTHVGCIPKACLEPGWDCIKGFNCR